MINYIISKCVDYIFLPPGLFIVLLLLALIFLLKNKKKISIAVILSALCLMYLFSIEPMKNFFLLSLENYAKEYGIKYKDLNPENSKCNRNCCGVIVVLGGGVYEGSPDYYYNASPVPDAVKRVTYAYLLYKKTGMKIITTGGKIIGSKQSTPEGRALKELLIDLGVPSSMIIEENSSRNTYENILNVKKILLLNHYRIAYIVTSAYHIKRAMLVCKRLEVKAIPVPTDYKINRVSYTIESFLPSSLYFYDLRKALHEYLGILYYKLMGTFGARYKK